MPRSKSNSSIATCREPFGKVTELMQVPIALYEILALAGELDDLKATQIAKLTENVIDLVLADPDSLVNLSNHSKKSS